MSKEVGAAPLCLFEEVDNGVYKFTFTGDVHAAVDEWAEHIERLQLSNKWYGRSKVRLLLDATNSGQLPLRYLFECLGDYNREYPHLVAPQVRLAYVYPSSFTMLDIFKLFATLLPVPTTAEFFTEEAYQEAVDWLLADS